MLKPALRSKERFQREVDIAPQATGAGRLHSGRPQKESLLPQNNCIFDERWVRADLSVNRNNLVTIPPTPDCYFSAQNSNEGWFYLSLSRQRLLDGLILQGKKPRFALITL